MEIKCPNCGYEGRPRKRIQRSSATVTGLLLLGSFFIPWLLVLGVPALVWMIFEKRDLSCPKCKFPHVIPVTDKKTA